MSRSVDYLSRALHVVYIDVSDFDNDGMDWRDMMENISSAITAKYPSLSECEDWDGRETRIFLRNSFAEIGISEYCGLASISIRMYESDYDQPKVGLAARWIATAWDGITKILGEMYPLYGKSGTFSNGEGVYARIGGAKPKGKTENFCHMSGGKSYEY